MKQPELKSPPALVAPRPRYDIVAVCGVLSLGILVLDLTAPMGMSSGVLYVAVIMYSLFADNVRFTWVAASGLTAMTLAGVFADYYHHHREFHEFPRILFVNAALALVLIWMTTLLGVRLLSIKRRVYEHGLELQRLNHELSNIARHDALTGVANRRYFDERLSQEILRALREKTNLSLLMIDIDYFKKYNDVNGHQAGDACITKVAQTIQACARRPGDMVARYGGEEFAVILPATPLSGAVQRADAICMKVKSLSIVCPGSEIQTSVTVSVGVATLNPTDAGATPQTLIFAADAALYHVKQNGRDGVMAAPEISQK